MTHVRNAEGIELLSETFCLDFANTAGSDSVHLSNYQELVSWCEKQGALTQEKASQLRDDARQQPASAERVLRKAITLREAIYGLFSTAATRRPPSKRHLRSLNRAVMEASKHLHIVQTADDFQWQWDDTKGALEFPLWLIARSAADLLTSKQRSRVRQCASDDCNWLFLDRSKNHSRRWCDMTQCGNREKARRSRVRQRAAKKI